MTGDNPRVSFRSARHDDVDAICVLWEAAGLGGGRDVDRAEITERLKNDDGFFVIAELVGHGGMVAVAMGCYDDHRGWMKRVAVHPDERGSGFGRLLVNEVERRFRDAGVTKLRLAVWDENRAAVAFWEELDYVELPEIRYFTKTL